MIVQNSRFLALYIKKSVQALYKPFHNNTGRVLVNLFPAQKQKIYFKARNFGDMKLSPFRGWDLKYAKLQSRQKNFVSSTTK